MKINMYKYWGLGFCIVGIIWAICITIVVSLDPESIHAKTEDIEIIISCLLIVIGITLLSIEK